MALWCQSIFLLLLARGVGAQDFEKAATHYWKSLINGEIKGKAPIHHDLHIPDMNKINTVIDPSNAPKAVNVLGDSPVDPATFDLNSKTDQANLAKLIKKMDADPKHIKEEEELKKRVELAKKGFIRSYKAMVRNGVKGEAFDKGALLKEVEEQKELPEAGQTWMRASGLLVLGAAAASMGLFAWRRARATTESLLLVDASDVETH